MAEVPGDLRIEPFGDAALLVIVGDRVDVALNTRAHAIAATVERLRAQVPALGRPVPAHASVLVPVDPLALDLDEAATTIRAAIAAFATDESAARRETEREAARPAIEIAVRYGGADGPDLEELASLIELRPSDIVGLHAGATYRVLFVGFAPGFAYLGPLPERLDTPRRSTPRERLPAGSVGIAAGQTGIYPRSMPGGWQLIGRTDASLWDLDRDPPSLLGPGDRVRFVPAPDSAVR